VLLPYESRDQVTSGVLIEAVASGKPVVSTDFPHARELLSSGAGIVVPHGSTEAMSSALERVLHDHRLARSMAAEAARISAPTMWNAVARRYLDVLVGLAVSQPRFGDLDLAFDRRGHARAARVDYTSHVA
jgi:glycosyltransferase involved in cell wall biosynthesis